MGNDTTPGGIARVRCTQCRDIVFFRGKGGPHLISCPTCTHQIRIEMVHDGTKWRIKDMQTARRTTRPSESR